MIDHCSLYIVDDQRGAISGTRVTFGQSEFGPTGRPNVLCDNTMNIGIGSFLSSQHSQTLICRNLQVASLGTVVANSEGACTERHDYVVRHNVLVAGPDGGGMWQNWPWRDRDSQRFVLHNNTMFWPGSQLMFTVPEWSRFKDLVHGDTHSVDHRADIYSLEATLYFLLVGKPMYPERTLVKKISAHRDHPIPKFHEPRPATSLENCKPCSNAWWPSSRRTGPVR